MLLVEVVAANLAKLTSAKQHYEPPSPRNSTGAWSSVYATVQFGDAQRDDQEYSTSRSILLDRPEWPDGAHEFATNDGLGLRGRRLLVRVFDSGPFKQDLEIGHCSIDLERLWRPDGSNGADTGFDRWVALEATTEGSDRSTGGEGAYCGEVRVAARLVAPDAADEGTDKAKAEADQSSPKQVVHPGPTEWLASRCKLDGFDEFGGALEPLPAVSARHRCFLSHAAILEERAQTQWVGFISSLTYDHELCESSQYAHLLYGGEEALVTWAQEPRTHQIRDLVGGGVPSSLRSKLWPLLAGGKMMETKVTALQPDYQGLVRRFKSQSPSITAEAAAAAAAAAWNEDKPKPMKRLDGVGQQIDTDLHRTFAQVRVLTLFLHWLALQS
jgi:hypothetical protein